MSATMVDERAITSVWEDPDYKIALAELEVLQAQQQARVARRRELEAILSHHANPRRYHLRPGLAPMDPRDARRERDALDRELEDLEREIETQHRAVEQAHNVASEKLFPAAHPRLHKRAADIERAKQNLAALKAAQMADIRDLEDKGVRGLTAFMAAAR